MSSESLATLAARTNRETARIINATFIDLEPDFQREYEAWSEKLCTGFIETIIIGRATNPIWLVVNEGNDCVDVLDGMHRLTTAIRFLNNQFRIGASVAAIDPAKYKNKLFRELPKEDQQRIRDYRFFLNVLDASYRNEDKLNDMYEILNCSAKPLNEYEQKKPLYKPLYELIAPYSARIFDSPLYPKTESKRGDNDMVFLSLLALAQPNLPTFSSLRDNYKKWAANTFGEKYDDIIKTLEEKKESLTDLSKRMIRYLDTFRNDERLFEGEDDMVVANKIIVARCAALIPTVAIFNRHSAVLSAAIKEKVFDRIREDNLGMIGRNHAFQKAVIAAVDAIIHAEIGTTPAPRLFSPAQIERRLAEQNKQCAICKKEIKVGQKYEGDHIVPWAAGGETVYENLQVVHKYKCHRVGKEAQEKLNAPSVASASPQPARNALSASASP